MKRTQVADSRKVAYVGYCHVIVFLIIYLLHVVILDVHVFWLYIVGQNDLNPYLVLRIEN